MLYLITGTPGAGKTQYTIDTVINNESFKYMTNEKGDKTERPVYYYGIPELKTGWEQLENAEDFVDCPTGSVIIIDEAHNHFPHESKKGKKPDHYVALATLRHKGYTIFLITQSPTDLDVYVRTKVGWHHHLERKFGSNNALIFTWDKAENPKDKSARNHTFSTKPYRYNKKIWELYKSAELHTVQRKLPLKLFYLPIAACLVLVPLYFIQDFIGDDKDADQPVDKTVLQDHEAIYSLENKTSPYATITQEEYVHLRTPLIDGQPWTSPIYDEVRKVVSWPRPQCLEGKMQGVGYRCICYTQQATKMDVPEDLCQGIVRQGYFDPAIEDVALYSNDKGYEPRIEEQDYYNEQPNFTVVGSYDQKTESTSSHNQMMQAFRDRLTAITN